MLSSFCAQPCCEATVISPQAKKSCHVKIHFVVLVPFYAELHYKYTKKKYKKILLATLKIAVVTLLHISD